MVYFRSLDIGHLVKVVGPPAWTHSFDQGLQNKIRSWPSGLQNRTVVSLGCSVLVNSGCQKMLAKRSDPCYCGQKREIFGDPGQRKGGPVGLRYYWQYQSRLVGLTVPTVCQPARRQAVQSYVRIVLKELRSEAVPSLGIEKLPRSDRCHMNSCRPYIRLSPQGRPS